MWTFYAKVRTTKGFTTKKPARLWSSKEAAEKDVELFIWYESIRGPDDPKVPYPRGQWFRTMLPDKSWDIVREYLSEYGQKHQEKKRKCDPNFVISKFARRENNRKKECRDDEGVSLGFDSHNAPHDANVEEKVRSPIKDRHQKPLTMRKRYSDLTVRRKVVVNKRMKDVIRDCWNELGPRQSDKELTECMRSTFPTLKTQAMKWGAAFATLMRSQIRIKMKTIKLKSYEHLSYKKI